uniref:Uncharacterized protein n=1 Tax=Kalanchoe fedtschenkoi TaxID=63787 RepID=A0A7N0UXB6_KALFE
METKEMRAKSFRNEDYRNRRVFLRSYPLQWEDEEEAAAQYRSQGKTRRVSSGQKKHENEMKPMKKLIIAVMEWSEGKVLILRRIKQKVAFYVVACIPVGFNKSTALISTK